MRGQEFTIFWFYPNQKLSSNNQGLSWSSNSLMVSAGHYFLLAFLMTRRVIFMWKLFACSRALSVLNALCVMFLLPSEWDHHLVTMEDNKDCDKKYVLHWQNRRALWHILLILFFSWWNIYERKIFFDPLFWEKRWMESDVAVHLY